MAAPAADTSTVVVTEPTLSGAPHIDAVANAASFSPGASAGGWVAIVGDNLSPTTRSWTDDDIAGGNLPVQLDGVAVTIGGKPAYVGYVSPRQINVLAPGGIIAGDTAVSVTSAPGHTSSVTSTMSEASPALFLWNGKYAVAQHADYTAVGAPGPFADMVTTPARPGEAIVLYATGFGATAPPGAVGEIVRLAAPLPSLPSVTVGGLPAVADYAGTTAGAAGLYQINVRVPDSAPDGDLPVSLSYGQGAATAWLTVRR